MKKSILLLIITLFIIHIVAAQEPGSYITVSGTLASTRFNYELDNGRKSSPDLGFTGNIGYQYFFNRNIGLATGIGISQYKSHALYYNSFEHNENYSFSGQFRDDDYNYDGLGKEYTMQIRLNDWKETQQAYFLEIPLMFMLQTKWGQQERIGLYFGVGAKVQIPIFGKKFTVDRGSELTVLGYYPESQLTMGDPYNMAVHGFGTIKNTDIKGNINIKTSIAGTVELGFLFGLSRRVDLTLGAYLDYGFNDIKKGNATNTGFLVEPNGVEHANMIGDNLQYNGMINSGIVVDKVNLMAIGGKLGIRIKLGKLKEEQIEEEKEELVQEEVEEEEEEKEEEKEPETIVIMEEQPAVIIEAIIPEPGITDAELEVLIEPIFFDLGKATLKPGAVISLDRKVTILNKYPKIKLLIIGNTCDLGGDRVNIPLGQRRADAACKYLENQGINLLRMETISRSSNNPIAPNTNEANRSRNRRTDFEPSDY